jgi:uncharacterized protein YkwD
MKQSTKMTHKMKPRIVVLGLIGFTALFIIASFVNAQDYTPPQPIIGASPTELTEPFALDTATENLQIDAAAAVSETVFLPIVLKPWTCDLNEQEQEIANFARSHPDQGRSVMNCDPILAQVARERALDMGTRNYFSHTNPDGFGPNYLVKQAGYALPIWYSQKDDANNVESIAAGYSTAIAAWTGWLNSSGHRTHVLAEATFWAEQTNFGVGYAYVPGSTYTHYWVFISAHPEE